MDEVGLLHASNLAFGIGEVGGGEGEVAPLEGIHPETVEVEDFHWNVLFVHFFEEGRDGLFVIGGCKACGQPETEAPRWRAVRFASQDRVFGKYFFRRRSVDEIPFQPLSLNTCLKPTAPLASDLEINALRSVDKDAISSRRYPEWDIFVSLLGRRSSVLIPNLDALSNFVESTEALTETMYGLSNAELSLCEDVVLQISHILCGFGIDEWR